MEVVFRNKCSKEYITSSALLFDVLMENNLDYPTRKMLARREQDLYNTNIYAVNSRVGSALLSNVVVDFLDPKYMENGSLEEIIKLAFSLIFNPNVDADEFDEETYNKVAKRLRNEIDSLKEDGKQNSILSALKTLDKNSVRALNSSGDVNILEALTPKKLYKFYQKILEESIIDIYIIGNLDMKEISKLIKKYSEFSSIKTHKIPLYLDEINVKKTINREDINNSTQMNLVQIYSFKNLDEFEINYVIPIFNLLWGTGSLDSKLYKTVRTENSLCYNINTFYQKYDRVIILNTQIDKQNYSKTVKLIKSCFQSMVCGDIKLSELDNVKKILINSLNLIYDNPGRLIDNYLFSNIASIPDIDTRIDEFKSVTINDLIKVAKKINLVVNYRIGG